MREAVVRLGSNAGVLRYLGDRDDPASVSIERPDDSTDTWRLGAHPDVVARLWVDLNAALPADARLLVAGGAALAHPESGEILAVALGTQYALRVADARLPAALDRGFETRHTFKTVGRTLDLAETFGVGWILGRHDADEPAWLAERYIEAGRVPGA